MSKSESKTERRRIFWALVRFILNEWSILQPVDGGWDWVTIQFRGRCYKFDLRYLPYVTRVGNEPLLASRLESALLYAIAKKLIRYNQMMYTANQRRKVERDASKKPKNERQLDLFQR